MKRIRYWQEKERVDSQMFFQMAPEVHNLNRTFYESLRSKMCQNYPETFFSVSESIWNSLPDHVIEAQSTNSFKNRLDKDWSDMGA